MAEEENSKKNLSAEMGSGSTLESLRGRLLAERQASRVANEEAELLDNKLRELEKKLKEETKLREKAEKKLKFLMKKLQSFDNISSSLTAQESSSSSTVTTSKDTEEEAESKFPHRIPESSTLSRHCNDDDHRSSSSRNEMEGSDGSVDNSMALVPAAESMAAAAAVNKRSSASESGELKMSEKGVGEVLEALRHAREKIEISMGGRRSCMITVAPI